MQTINIIQILSDIGAGKRGSHEGVKWLCERHSIQPVAMFENHSDSKHLTPPAKYIDNLTAFFQQFIPTLTQYYQQPEFPVILTGDHSNAVGTLSALCNAYPNKRIGIIWIDAHADLHTPYTTPSGNIHGMSLAALLRQDNLSQQIHTLTPEVESYWQHLKQLAPTAQGILPKDICFLGLRDFEPQEQALIEELSIPYYSTQKIRELGFEKVLTQVKQQFADVDLLYVSFDVDALDANLISATGTPVSEGFTETEMTVLLEQLLALPNLSVFEITEFNPTLSENAEEYEMVYRLFRQALAQIQKR
ncbi:arginase [Ursidibacter sp. B-7004-1]